jgi:crotonobetainyl-CoA:carnitine CoA-transferase CaiB-like acyl-CoA transferase
MALTGRADGPPQLAPAPVTTAVSKAAAGLTRVANTMPVLDAAAVRALDAPALLGERAAIFGQARGGSTSVGRTCHLLRCADGWLAVNLARPEDRELLPAWLGDERIDDPREFVESRVRDRDVSALVERARLLGLPAAAVCTREGSCRSSWLGVTMHGTSRAGAPTRPPVVVDLSSLWAGPLCAHLLGLAGARVIKVESTARPDGARRGPSAFFDLLNGGKASVALDISSNDGVRVLRALLERADIVVESSRPRALEQLGVDAGTFVGTAPGRVWVSITGYGRDEPAANWVAFGDDAAAAGGLVVWPDGTDGAPIFCGDAIADPLSGMHAAYAALSYWQRGDGALLDVALQRVSASVASEPITLPRGRVTSRNLADGTRLWEVLVAGERRPVVAPRARVAVRKAGELGADTRDVLLELAVPC